MSEVSKNKKVIGLGVVVLVLGCVVVYVNFFAGGPEEPSDELREQIERVRETTEAMDRAAEEDARRNPPMENVPPVGGGAVW